MALKSMTGFGEGCASIEGVQVVAELSSVNRKQLDIMSRRCGIVRPHWV
jgi:uncharacterized protein YicC (UPF0701 family)